MSTQFIGASPSATIGYKNYYRITFDVSGQGLLFGTGAAKLNFFYDHMQDTGALQPLSPNPVVAGDDVMVVDAITIDSGSSLSLAEAVRRLEEISGGIFSSVREIRKLSGIGDVTGGAGDRDQATADTNKQNAEDSLGAKVQNFFSGLGMYTQLGVIALVAYTVLSLSAGLPVIPSRKRG